jgi:signal transduction histidine kinase/CheY-like chemotaxis protein/ligand-binding sensor domain-containing protein
MAFALILAGPLSLLADENWTPVRSFRLFPRSLWRGLPQSTVASMAQDTDGILWIGTFDGLASFDGLELTPVATVPNAPVRGVLTAMTARRQGGLYVTSPAGVHVSEDGAWRLVPSNRTALALAEAADGVLWMADVGGAVWTLGKGDTWEAHPEMREKALALTAAVDGSIWAATATGATRLNGGTATAVDAGVLKGAPSAILAARDGRVWMTTLAGTLHWTRADDPIWREVELRDWPPGGQFRGLAEDRRGRVWAGTIDGNVAFGNPEIGWTTWGLKNAPVGGIQTILADREGSVWFGVNRNGLAQWVGEAWSHRVAFPDGARPAERTSMTGMTRGQGDHSLLVSGFASGVVRLADGEPPRIWAAAEGITEHARQAVEPEPGTLWVAARFGILEGRGSATLRYTLRLRAGFATGLFKSPQGEWYAATSTEGVFSREGNAWVPVPTINQDLDDQHVRGMIWTSTGEMWVETLRGVSIFRDERIVEKISQAKVAEFPQPVNAVVEAGNGDMWVGGSGGIAVRTGPTWRALDMTNGPGPTIYSMAKAADGSIWAGGASGVGRYADGRWTTWDSRSGLLEDECNLNGMLIDQDGSVFVGTMGGLARFDPTVEALAPPPLKLRWLQAPAAGPDGRVALAGRELQLRWSAAWLGSHPVEYRVRMPRLRDAWSEPTLDGRLDIQNLGPGHWPVEVEARVEGTDKWTEPLRLDVVVTPYWHETLPARAGLVAVLALAGVGLVRFRLSRLRQHAAALESTVSTRTAELADKVALLEESERRAQAASRAKTTFLANMSHELRTPLNGVLGFAQLMARRPARDPEDRRHLSIILRSGEHLLGLINDVLSMARIEAGETSLNQETFSPSAVVMSVEQLLRPKADAKGLGFHTEIAPDIPLHVVGDAGKLRQILLNLVGNAIKFTARGEVIVKASWASGRGIFEVSDTGPGIDSAETGALFEPFVQTETGRNSREGTGLGLALSQDLARLMGGRIRVESVVGRGSTFGCEVSLPLAPPGNTSEEAIPDTRRVRGLAPGQPAFRVLVVDDVKENRDALSGLLAAVGFDVHTASSGEEALDLWRQFRPHLIWMDKRMPGMDGLETTRRIRAAPAHDGPMTRIIVLSASALDHERSEIMQSGCDDFLAKPFREEAIFSKMAECLGVVYEYDAPETSPGAAPRAGETASPADDASHALAVARRLATLVATGDLAALEVQQALRKALGARHAEALLEIETRLRGMEFDSATPLIADLCTALALPVESPKEPQ